MSEKGPRPQETNIETIVANPELEPQDSEATVALNGLAQTIILERQAEASASEATSTNAENSEATDSLSDQEQVVTRGTGTTHKHPMIEEWRGQRRINKETKATVLEASNNGVLESIWGADLGTKKFEERMDNMRLMQRRRARKAHRQYKRNVNKVKDLRESLYPEPPAEEPIQSNRENTEKRSQASDDEKVANLRTRVKNYINRKLKGTPEHEFKHPGYYFDTENILSLREEIKSTIEQRVSLSVADALDNGLDENSVDTSTIEHETTLEGVANYLGFQTWEEAEEKTPSWLIEPIVDLYGMSDEQLREYGITDPNKANDPAELEHDDTIEISNNDNDDEIIETPGHESNEELPKWNSVGLFIEMSRPENRDNGVYDRALDYLTEEIEDDIKAKTIDVKNPAEKHKIAAEVYADQIATMLGVTKDELNDPSIVPKELTDQISGDVTKARKQLKQANQPTPESKPEPAKPEAKKTVEIDWDKVLEPSEIKSYFDQEVKLAEKRMNKYLINNPGAKDTDELYAEISKEVEEFLLPKYLGIESMDDLKNYASKEHIKELERLLSMDYEELQALIEEDARRSINANARRTAIDL